MIRIQAICRLKQQIVSMKKSEGIFRVSGITFSIIKDKITVIDVIESGPSEKAGIKSRDKIVKINNKDATGFTNDDVKDNLRGASGSKVRVHVERPGEEKLLVFTITRDKIALNSVSHSYMMDDITGYIAVKQFTINTGNDN